MYAQSIFCKNRRAGAEEGAAIEVGEDRSKKTHGSADTSIQTSEPPAKARGLGQGPSEISTFASHSPIRRCFSPGFVRNKHLAFMRRSRELYSSITAPRTMFFEDIGFFLLTGPV